MLINIVRVRQQRNRMAIVRRTLLVLLCALSSPLASSAQAAQSLSRDQLAVFLRTLSAPPTAALPFVEHRMSKLLREPLQLTGELRIEADGAIDKRILKPFQERVQIKSDTLIIEGGQGRRTVNLARDKRWRAFHAGIAGLINRDATALSAAFAVTLEQSAEAWTMRLQPRGDTARSAPMIIATGKTSALTDLRIEQSKSEWQAMHFTSAAP
jgi:Outer membrane lipoprotein carrier protein LolA-like